MCDYCRIFSGRFYNPSTVPCVTIVEFPEPVYILKLYYVRLVKILKSIMSSGARSVMVIVVGNGHGDTGSNPGRD